MTIPRPLTSVESRLLEQAFRQYAAGAARRSARSYRDPCLAEDAVQEAFVQLAQRIVSGDATPVAADPSGAVHRNTRWAAGRLFAAHRSRRAKEQMALTEALVSDAAEQAWSHSEARLLLEAILDRLSPEQRALLLERVAGDGPDADAALRRGLTVKAYRRRRDRALLAARRIAEQLGAGTLPALTWLPRTAAPWRLRLRERLHPAITAARELAGAAVAPIATAALLCAMVSSAGTPPGAAPSRGQHAQNASGARGGVAGADAAAAARSPHAAGGLGTLHQATAPAPAAARRSPAAAAPLPLVGGGQETPDDAIVTAVQGSGDDGSGSAVVLALGHGNACSCEVIFRSLDGGTSWEAAPGPPGGDQILLPPGYPEDPRIFVSSTAPSVEATYFSPRFGAPFTPLPVPPGHLAVTSAFGRDDDRVYISAVRGVWSYDTRAGAITALALPIDPTGLRPAAIAAPGASGAQVIALVPHSRPPTSVATQPFSAQVSTLMACSTAQTCTALGDVPLPTGAWLAVSPDYAHDGVVLAGMYDSVYRSSDGGRSFVRVSLPAGEVPVGHFTFQTTMTGTSVWATMFTGGGGVLARSDDGGATWRPVLTRPSGPAAQGPALLHAHHIVVSVNSGGLLCSPDEGASWQPSCPDPVA